jgi:hypothetical protein
LFNNLIKTTSSPQIVIEFSISQLKTNNNLVEVQVKAAETSNIFDVFIGNQSTQKQLFQCLADHFSHKNYLRFDKFDGEVEKV